MHNVHAYNYYFTISCNIGVIVKLYRSKLFIEPKKCDSSISTKTRVLKMYFSYSGYNSVHQVFDQMSKKIVEAWDDMNNEHIKGKNWQERIEVFNHMQR